MREFQAKFASEEAPAVLGHPGSTVYTDGLKSFAGLQEAGFEHVPRIQPMRVDLRKGAKSVVPLADRAIGNLQRWLIGTITA
jgi:transposase-like protein